MKRVHRLGVVGSEEGTCWIGELEIIPIQSFHSCVYNLRADRKLGFYVDDMVIEHLQ